MNEISVISSDLRTNIYALLANAMNELPFSGLPVVLIGDFLQLLPVKVRFIFSKSANSSGINGFNVCQLLNGIQIGNMDENVENLLKTRFICESYQNYPSNALHM